MTAGSAPEQTAKTAFTSGQLQGEERIQHALNRLAFGPRPGDVKAVEAMGLDRWIELQLHPDRIDDSALDERLLAFPAIKLEQGQLMRRFPRRNTLKKINRSGQLPSDPVERAIYNNALDRLQQKKQTGRDDAPAAVSSAADAAAILSLAPDARMERILAMSPDEWRAFRRGLNFREAAALADGLSPEQRETLLALRNPSAVVTSEERQERLIRSIYSERQLEAVMTDFWLNHFSVYYKKNQTEPYLLPAYEREVIRPRALGRFEDLLVATAQSPAMLIYLDNQLSVGPNSPMARRAEQRKPGSAPGLNENYARELMELHTLGVNGGYTQADVTQVAKVLTGWGVRQSKDGVVFDFNERRHEPGSKQVLGKTIPEGGEAEGLAVLHRLATSPATAKFISTKLCVRFVSDTPPPALVDRMARAFLESGGDIRVVLRAMLRSPEFWSRDAYRAKVKTPVELVVSAVRASGAEASSAQPLLETLNRLGMTPYGMLTPNGYSWMATPWISTGALVNRMNFAMALSYNRLRGVQTDWTELLGRTASGDAAARERRLEKLLLEQPASGKTRESILAEAVNGTAPPQMPLERSRRSVAMPVGTTADNTEKVDAQAALLAGLLMGSPEFQRR